MDPKCLPFQTQWKTATTYEIPQQMKSKLKHLKDVQFLPEPYTAVCATGKLAVQVT